jgi:hypothetical protein
MTVSPIIACDGPNGPQLPEPRRLTRAQRRAAPPPAPVPAVESRAKGSSGFGQAYTAHETAMSLAFIAVLMIGGYGAFTGIGAIGGLAVALAVLQLRDRMLS